uniref:SIS domain-containing protein n=1 Tax=Thermorudis peleae TaxID=1382356 RepID=A0A831X0V0_9BACT
MTVLEREIHEQPEALARLIQHGRPLAEALAARIVAFQPTGVVIAARGSSDNAARYAQYLFGAHNRLVVALATPSLFTLYQSPPSLAGKLVIGISQSGRSPDIVAVIAEARRQGALTIALTNAIESPLAQAAEHVFPLHAGEERAIAATKTYTAELVALAMLSSALEAEPARWDALAAVPGAVQRAIELNAPVRELVNRFRYARHFAVIGRGFNYATAFEIALKMKETSYVIAEPYSSADFLHGPIAVIDEGFPVVAIAPSGKVLADMTSLIDVLDERRAELIVISDRQELLDRARAPLPLPASVPEWLSPVTAAVPGQLWAHALAVTRGLDPDRPRGLRKVTETL